LLWDFSWKPKIWITFRVCFCWIIFAAIYTVREKVVLFKHCKFRNHYLIIKKREKCFAAGREGGGGLGCCFAMAWPFLQFIFCQKKREDLLLLWLWIWKAKRKGWDCLLFNQEKKLFCLSISFSRCLGKIANRTCVMLFLFRALFRFSFF